MVDCLLLGQVYLTFFVSDKRLNQRNQKEQDSEMLLNPLHFKFVVRNEIQLGELKEGEY